MYQDLIVWKKSVKFVSNIYLVTRNIPKSELFGLTNQLRRASISIPVNIAEGYGRNSKREFLRFFGYSLGSLFEVQTQIRISYELKVITANQFNCLYDKTREIERLLSALIDKIKTNLSLRKNQLH